MRDERSTRVGETNISQPISVCLQLCLTDLLRSWGIQPAAVTSHSSGEIAAAYCVGAISFHEAVGAAFYRGDLALQSHKQTQAKGGMLAVGLGANKVKPHLSRLTKGKVVVACLNSPESTTLSGDIEAIEELESKLKGQEIFARKMKVPIAYHSHHMEDMAPNYLEALQALLQSEKPRQWDEDVAFYSPVTGARMSSPKQLGPSHWVKNLVSPVRFSQAFGNMTHDDHVKLDLILEIGAHGTLSGPIRQIFQGRGTPALPYVSCLSRGTDAVHTMQEMAGFLVSRGAPVHVSLVNSISNTLKHRFSPELPTYAWNHSKKFWFEPRLSKHFRYPGGRPHQLLGSKAPGGHALAPTWRQFLRLDELPWLNDHQLEGRASKFPFS